MRKPGKESNDRSLNERPIDIGALFEEGSEIDAALREAVRHAVLRHKRMGNPIAVWRDSHVVWIPPEEIAVD
jgi:hypothetical protein